MTNKSTKKRIILGLLGVVSIALAKLIWGKRKKIGIVIAAGLAGILIIFAGMDLFFAVKKEEISLAARSGYSEPAISAVYYATPQYDGLIYSGQATLERILIGTDVTSGEIKVADSITSTDGIDPIFYVTGSTMSGVWEIGALMNTGIITTVTEQTNATFFYVPR